MIEAFHGEKYETYFGRIQIRKIYVPWILLIMISIAVPNASFSGHLCGILSALLLKYSGLAKIFLPQYNWIKDFD
jgi:hypothetical protein